MPPRSRHLSTWVDTRVTSSGADGVTLHFDGSLEAAVVARICQGSGRRVVGLLLSSDQRHHEYAREVAHALQLPVLSASPAGVEHAISHLVASADIPPARVDGTATAHDLRRRVAAVVIQSFARRANTLLAGLLDRTSLVLGQYVRHADDAVDILPLGSSHRTHVYALAHELQVPAQVLQGASRADDTWRTAVGVAHVDVERYLRDGPDAVVPAVAMRVERMLRNAEHLQALPHVPQDD